MSTTHDLPRRSRARRDLSVAEVVHTALDIAGRDGEAGVTMRAVAEACGVTPMALYHHVASKDELLTLLVDHVVGSAIEPLGSDPARWREELVEFAVRYRRALVANPVAAMVYLRRPILSPNLALTTEILFTLLARGGFEGPGISEAADAIVLLLSGSISNDLTRPAEVRRRLADQLPAAMTPLLLVHLDRYSDRDPEQRFRTALDALLDGLVQRHHR